MLNRTAENSFERGKEAFEAGRWKEALAFFEAAVAIERRAGTSPPQARYISYYGLCLALAGRQFHTALKLCREAAAIERYNPDAHWNLGRVLLACRRRKEAHAALIQGLRHEPTHSGLRREILRMGWRKRPVLSFLSRSHPLNVFLGRRRAARAEAKAAAAGARAYSTAGANVR
jgi:tetratricopeptide (TPR) repeat protein